MKFESYIDVVPKLNMHCVLITDSVLEKLADEGKSKYNQRLIITINNKIQWHGGVVAFGNGYGYITISKDRMKQLNVAKGDKINVELLKDDSEFGHEFPIELQELFYQDTIAKDRFFGLTPGKQRTIIYYILQCKTSDKRIERSIQYMENLKKSPVGKETMRMLMGKWD